MKNSFLLLLFLFPFINYSQNDIEKVKATISKSEIEGHIYFLASDELKGRQTGTAENKIAAQYLANMLRSYGVKPVTEDKSYLQKVVLNSVSQFDKAELKIKNFSTSKIVTINKTNTSYSGSLAFVNYGFEKDYANVDVKGKIVVSYSGTKENSNLRFAFSKTQEKIKIAKEKGAIGIIELNNIDNRTWSQLDHSFNGEKMYVSEEDTSNNFTYLWVNDQKEEISKFFTDKNEVNGSINIQGIKKGNITTQNVVGMVEGTDPKLKDEYIIYSAHYDHVGIGKAVDNDSIYNGARDNAVGTVTVLSAAKNIAKYPTKRSALFILFTGEEKGLLGSKWYVENPLIPLNKMVYCFNSDNGGYNDTSIATIVGLERTTASDDIKKAATPFGLKAIDDPAPEQGLFDRSDNVHFAAKGIPAPTFSMGFTAFDEEITKYYHQVTDNPDTLDYDYLLKFFQSYVLACRNIANNPKTPFWVEGDKYYDAGIKLYNKK
ncbi:aminopeptidase [Aquimarina sp. AD1]|uniref:M28 family peptidase n=1 Tax=Aquimarina sp. (strain AD1) TaxID=1714848 RepID=UPI000E552D31|nr:M28 family peptidase [Aquimarina sp. AD1]AXT54274.1 aminopeptidase [Aquimarina sp. AD1]RKN08000.1 M28 family peptidase [Aquimarina sp. AD1]